jgi:hypothetical protein
MSSAGPVLMCTPVSGPIICKDCLLEYKMKINYPVINYKFVTEKDNLGDAIAELTDRPFETCILQKGQYYLEGEKYAAKSVQIIGPETGVHINTST